MGPNVFLGEGVRRCDANDIDAGSPGKGYSRLIYLAIRKTLSILPAPRQSNPLTKRGCPSLARHD